MAGDLIPPPSPAGKPDPNKVFTLTDERDEVDDLDTYIQETEAAEMVEKSRFQGRFGLITGGLIGIGIAALAVVVMIVAQGPSKEPAWSKWKPQTEDRNLQIIEIGRYVSSGYRLDNGDQLNKVDAEPLELDGAPLRVVVRTTGVGEGANIEEIDGRTVLYTLKGLGPRGSIDSGEPSEKRLRLLQREATEIALYTFRYVKGVDNVVALLPPPPPEKGSPEEEETQELTGETSNLPAMLFRPGDLEQAIKTPLESTFPGEAPRPSTLSEAEANGFKLLAEQHQFNASITSDQLGTGVLVLDRVSASTAVEDAIRSIGKA